MQRTHGIHVDRQVVGFFNAGNSCFLNASMQLLLSIAPLREMCESATETTSFLSALKEAKHVPHASDLLRPGSSLWKCVELFVGYSPRALLQHDAFEFLLFFFGNLDEELQKRPPRQVTEEEKDPWHEVSDGRQRIQASQRCHYGASVLYEVLGLSLRHEYHVLGSQKYIRVLQEELVICLNAQEKSLALGFNELLCESAVEDYQDDGLTVKCARSGKIENFAPYLMVALKRFRRVGNESQKLDNFVEFPNKLQIPNQLLTPTLGLAISQGTHAPPIYTLVGFIIHHGRTPVQGHYTSVLRSEGRWLSLDDQRVQSVSQDWVRRQKAYVLLYVFSA